MRYKPNCYANAKFFKAQERCETCLCRPGCETELNLPLSVTEKQQFIRLLMQSGVYRRYEIRDLLCKAFGRVSRGAFSHAWQCAKEFIESRGGRLICDENRIISVEWKIDVPIRTR
jgi:hypothetical protein